jgi:transcriptional antiterminator RfaH
MGPEPCPTPAPQPGQQARQTDRVLPEPPDNRDWYVVQSKRADERRVVEHLTRKHVQTFLPLLEVVQRRRTKCVRSLEPLFPGYLFVHMPALQACPGLWYAVRWTPGVRRILGTDNTPVAMPPEAVRAIQTRTADLGFVRPRPRFQSGDAVRIRLGPLAGLEAVFDCPMPRSGRVRVLLQLLGQVGRVEVDELDLESA